MSCDTRRTAIRRWNTHGVICNVDKNVALGAAHAAHYVNNCHAKSTSSSDSVCSNALATGYVYHSAFLIFLL